MQVDDDFQAGVHGHVHRAQQFAQKGERAAALRVPAAHHRVDRQAHVVQAQALQPAQFGQRQALATFVLEPMRQVQAPRQAGQVGHGR